METAGVEDPGLSDFIRPLTGPLAVESAGIDGIDLSDFEGPLVIAPGALAVESAGIEGTGLSDFVRLLVFVLAALEDAGDKSILITRFLCSDFIGVGWDFTEACWDCRQRISKVLPEIAMFSKGKASICFAQPSAVIKPIPCRSKVWT